MITEGEALRQRRALPANKRRLKEIDREMKRLRKEQDLLVEDVRIADDIRVHKGRPYLGGYPGDFENIEETRCARVSKRAVDEFFNVELRDLKPFGFHSHTYGHVHTVLKVTEKHATQIALAWILDDIDPRAMQQ